MKRQLNFDFENDRYVIKENDNTLFSIDGKELKFISLDFYNGVYKDKSAAIELSNIIHDDPLRKGEYIFNWLKDIINSIQSLLAEPEPEDIEISAQKIDFPKKVSLFELSACAGDGFFTDYPSNINSEIDCPFKNADYAVKISGTSMEPTIQDGSVVFVQDTKELSDGDIGIFIVNSQVMCKRYRKLEESNWLEPDNKSSEYSSIQITDDVKCFIQGKVILSGKVNQSND